MTAPGRLRALVLASLVVGSVLAASVVVPTATAAANSETFDVTTDASQSNGTITVEGDVDNTGDVSFLIQDPDDGDVATVTTSVGSTSFNETIDLSGVSFAGGDGQLDEGTATVLVDEGSSFETAEAGDTFVVDDSKPQASFDAPIDGAELTEQPTIDGTASDDTAVASVDLVVQRQSDDNYYNGSSWVTSEQTVAATNTTNWEYDTSAAGISADGTYEVSVEVTDTAGNTRETVVPQPNRDSAEIRYTVDTQAPEIDSTTVTDATDGDGTVTTGDQIDVSATVTDATSGVETVTVDASAIGGQTDEPLTADGGDTYTTTIDVTNPSVGDGTFDLNVTAEDAFGNAAQKAEQDTLTLETSVADVETLSVEHDFVGIVRDADRDLTVTADGITDPRGNTITGPTTVDITFDGQTVGTATVTDGSIDTTVDPVTGVANDTELGDATVAIAQSDAAAATATVELVDEAKNLQAGYQVMGTPMPLAEDPVFEDVGDVTTYDPTAPGDTNEWVSPQVQEAGEGYYVEGQSDDARIGYVFEKGVSDGVEGRTLHEGFNLVGTSVDLDTTTGQQATDDLGGAVTVESNVDVWVRDDSVELDQSTDTAAYDSVGGTETVEAFDGYFVYVDSGEEYRNVVITSYEPSDRE